MTIDKARQEFGEKFVATFAESLEKHGEQFLSGMRDKDPLAYRRMVDALFGNVEDKNKITDSMIFDEMLKRMKRQSI